MFELTEVAAMRKAKGWTQKDLAAHAGVSFSLITKIERGDRKNPTLDILNKLSLALTGRGYGEARVGRRAAAA